MANFVTDTTTYYKDGPIDAKDATDIEFSNQGLSVCAVNGRTIPVGGAMQINGFPGEKNQTAYQVRFVGGTGILHVTRRIYK